MTMHSTRHCVHSIKYSKQITDLLWRNRPITAVVKVTRMEQFASKKSKSNYNHHCVYNGCDCAKNFPFVIECTGFLYTTLYHVPVDVCASPLEYQSMR